MASAAPPAIENRGPQLEAVALAFLGLAVVSFSLRVYVRAFMVRGFGTDDWFMSAAAVAFFAYISCVLDGVRYGTGRHFADLARPDMERALEYWWFCYIWYCWTMIFSKISIGIFLVRIVITRASLWTIYGAMLLSVLTGLVFFLVSVMQCQPVSYFWDKTNPRGGSCISVNIIIDLTYLYSAFNIVCDSTFALTPIFIIAKLNMTKRLKLASIPLMSMGCMASAGVVVRMAYVQRFRDPDFLFATVDIAIWSTVEAGLAITAGSLACVRPLFKLVLHWLGMTGAEDPYPVSSNKGVRSRNRLWHGHLEPHIETIGSARSRPCDAFGLHILMSTRRDADGDVFGCHGHGKQDDTSIAKGKNLATCDETKEPVVIDIRSGTKGSLIVQENVVRTDDE